MLDKIIDKIICTMDARQQSRKQVEYLMLKKPPIGNEQGDDTTEEPSEYHISSTYYS